MASLQFVLGLFGSLMVGVGLWLFLPRGVVLTRVPDGPDSWTIRNDSALPVRIVSVTEKGINTYDEQADKFASIELQGCGCFDGEESTHGVGLCLDDEVADTRMYSMDLSWKGTILPPGETLTAFVGNNTSLQIRYRRSGWAGIFERRYFEISGGV